MIRVPGALRGGQPMAVAAGPIPLSAAAKGFSITPVSELVQGVEASIQTRNLLKPGQSVLVAVSGGLDSMVLLEALRRLAAIHHWRLRVAHLNHRLRGRSSQADERWVREMAARGQIVCTVGQAN